MDIADFDYDLPAESIAQRPLERRADSRLLVLDRPTGAVDDRRFPDIVDLIAPEDLLVVNDTRVIPARLYARKPTGGRVELLVERVVDEHCFTAQIGTSKAVVEGMRIETEGGRELIVEARDGAFWRVRATGDDDVGSLIEVEGHMPLPPYIDRADEDLDRTRYQTVYAAAAGAVAAPTAGLHFDEALLERIRAKGVSVGTVTLHVGAGTFQPVRSDRVEDHRMHAERIIVTEALCAEIAAARARGGRVIAVGTTVVRALESAAAEGAPAPFVGETRLFITPGYAFRAVDALITNFHQPRSTLLVLISAFAGRDHVLAAYAHAVAAGYRFLSYGDAMFIADAQA